MEYLKNTNIKKFFSLILVFLLLLVLLAVVNYLQHKSGGDKLANQQTNVENNVSVEAGYTPRPLVQGKETYSVTGGRAPYITEISIDPLDIVRLRWQTVSVKINNPTPVEKVVATIITDDSETPHELTLIDGIGTNGTWEGRWLSMVDSGIKNYQAKIEAESINESSEIVLTFR